jgi:uncharacterized membrane protein YcaP (DUF421 family)
LDTLFGTAHNVSAAQECARALVIFIYGLVMLRLSGRRTFARMSALDLVVTIIVGSVLGQALTGSAPMGPALVGIGVLILLHWLVAQAVARNQTLSRFVEGVGIPLVRDGILNERARLACKISYSDLAEALRQKGLAGLDELGKTKTVDVEPSGRISVIKRS